MAHDDRHDDPDPRIGARSGAFRVDATLGSGGMGVVYRALDTRLERHVALKLVRDDAERDPERRQRIVREARLAASLVHAGIATIYEVGEVDGSVYIAMELVDGRSLRAVLEGERLSVERAVAIGAAIADALGAAHARGVVHRDVKPENVMIGDDGRAKILDFGIAKPLPTEGAPQDTLRTHTGRVLGTPEYMSPEQARGALVDARSDVFALGVVLYEMLAGRRPFRGATAVAILLEIMVEEPLPLGSARPEVPEHVAAVVARCLEKAPHKRFANGGEVASALLPHASVPPAVAEDRIQFLPTLASPSNGTKKPRAPIRRRAIGAAFALALVALPVVWLAGSRTPVQPLEKEPRPPVRVASRPHPIDTGPLVETEVLVPETPTLIWSISVDALATRLAYVASTGELYVLDLTTRDRARVELPAGDAATGVEFARGSSDRLVLSVSNADDVRVVELALDDGSTQVVARRAQAARVSPSARYLASWPTIRELQIRDRPRQSVVRTIGGVLIGGAAWDWREDALYFTRKAGGAPASIARASGPGFAPEELVSSFRLGGVSMHTQLAGAPSGMIFAMHDPPPLLSGSSLWLLPRDGGRPRPVARLPSVDIGSLAVALDGRFLAVDVSTTVRDVRVAPIERTRLGPWRVIATDGHSRVTPGFSARGGLVFATDRHGPFELVETDLDRGNPRPRARSRHTLAAPVWESDEWLLAWEMDGPDADGRVRASIVRIGRAGERAVVRAAEVVHYDAGTPRPRSLGFRCGGGVCLVMKAVDDRIRFERFDGSVVLETIQPASRALFAIDAVGGELAFVSGDGIVRVDLSTLAATRTQVASGLMTQSVAYVGAGHDLLVSTYSDTLPQYRVYRVSAGGRSLRLFASSEMWAGELACSPDGRYVAASTETYRTSIVRVLGVESALVER